MPPLTKAIESRLDDRTTVEATLPPDLATIASFFGMDGFAAALRSTAFSRKEMTERLVNIIRAPESDAVAINAMKTLHSMGRDVLELHGQVLSLQETRNDPSDPDRTITASSRTLSHLLSHAPSTDPSIPPAGVTVRSPTPHPELPPPSPTPAPCSAGAYPGAPVPVPLATSLAHDPPHDRTAHLLPG